MVGDFKGEAFASGVSFNGVIKSYICCTVTQQYRILCMLLDRVIDPYGSMRYIMIYIEYMDIIRYIFNYFTLQIIVMQYDRNIK